MTNLIIGVVVFAVLWIATGFIAAIIVLTVAFGKALVKADVLSADSDDFDRAADGILDRAGELTDEIGKLKPTLMDRLWSIVAWPAYIGSTSKLINYVFDDAIEKWQKQPNNEEG